MNKFFASMIVALVVALSFSSSASAGDHGNNGHKPDAISSAIEKHGKITGENMSLGNVAYESDCYKCSSQVHNDAGDGSHVDVDVCDVTVKDPVYGKTSHQFANLNKWVHTRNGGGGSWTEIDYDDVKIKKGVLEVKSLGIVCEAIESGSNHAFDYRSRNAYDDGWYSRSRTRGRSEKAVVSGVEHSFDGDVTWDTLEHTRTKSSNPYFNGKG